MNRVSGYVLGLVLLSVLPFFVWPTLYLPYKFVWTLAVWLMLYVGVHAYVKKRSVERLRRWLFVTLSVFLGTLLLEYVSVALVLYDVYGLEMLLERYEEQALYVFALFSFLQPIVFPVPEAVTIPIGSLILGALPTALIGTFMTTLGIMTMYAIARFGRERFVDKLVDAKQLGAYERYVDKYGLWVLIVLFVIPILPDEIICIAAGLSRVDWRKLLGIALVSKAITSFSLSYALEIGPLLASDVFRFVLAVGLVALVTVVAVLGWKRHGG